MEEITDFKKNSIETFLNQLSSSSYTPGGGSAAALTATVGTALMVMVARINHRRETKKNKPNEKQSAVEETEGIVSLNKIQEELTEIITEDARTYSKLVGCSTDPNKKMEYQQALKEGARVPLRICELALEAAKLGFLEKDRTSSGLISDLIEAGILLEASFQSGRLNVEINLKNIQDLTFVNQTKDRLNCLEKEIAPIKQELTKAVKK